MSKTTKVPKLPKGNPVRKRAKGGPARSAPQPAATEAPTATAEIIDRLWATIVERRSADPERSHSARLLSRGTAKVAQKFGEEAVECLIEAVANNPTALVSESADVLYHLTVLWVAAGVEPAEVWAELTRREGVSGIAEKAARSVGRTRKIP
ncbi:MAG: phosphoribosyl-ATP diphosphatase [Pseudomonadota bacterium]|nr:phosphoribosyl-ATP diphosphatase [Pseudomonadota bacterium]